MASSIRLTPETEQRLNFLVYRTGRIKAYYLREIIEHGIETLKTTTLHLKCLSAFSKGKKKYIPQHKQGQILAWTIEISY